MNANVRQTYLGASVSTASPQRLLVMLYQRLVLDLQRGRDAQEAGQREEANGHLLHAQDIVMELRISLRTDAWSGAPALASLYDWMYTQLVLANTRCDAAMTEHVLALAEQLCDTWRQAALQAAG
ncbi:flagellar export chaperone FliS [Nocardioides jishulii]|uniref:Flagellar export chaperone FliS n=1 Tax=Nocardioides jishulii TaxID=2575440 RepID=A0A4U2YWI5_9ACTN|nr:flagellar export chaperone FliS [Nocardioides jishulii]QCX28576.1 flagellar export chaperone FliS [Nocardioides jishulii]TKI64531.1 flagellar export chaperone FliS [Nocardioides jishulii]